MLTQCLVFLISNLVLCGVAFAAPLVLYTDIVDGPGTGGENNLGTYLTINGKGFGSTRGTSTVTIGGGAVGSYKSWSDTRIQVQIGAAASTGNIVVTVGGSSSTAPDTFTVRSGDLYFISTSGSDSAACTYAAPCRTANHVEQLAGWGAGDTLVVRGGTYDLNSGNENLSNGAWLNIGRDSQGTATNRYAVIGYPGETVTVSWGSDTSASNRGVRCMWRADYWTISNIVFDMKNSGGVSLYLGFYSNTTAYMNHARLVNLTVTGGMAGSTFGVNALSLQRVDYIKIYGLDIGNQSASASSALESHVIYMSHFYTDAEIAYSRIHDNQYGRAAFQVAGDSWGGSPVWGNNSNVRIHHNEFKNLPEAAILFNLGSVGPVYFYDNIINNVCTLKPAGFSAISFRGAGSNSGVYYFYNNTVYTDSEDYNPGGILQLGYTIAGTYPEHVYLRNNIIYAKTDTTNYYQVNHGSFSTSTNLTSSNNLWYGSTDSTPSWDTNPQSTDPNFTALGSNFSLQSNSPAINHGYDTSAVLTTDYIHVNRADTFDIGAYEYNGRTILRTSGGTVYRKADGTLLTR